MTDSIQVKGVSSTLVGEDFLTSEGEVISTPSAIRENEMSLPEKQLLSLIVKPAPPLSYPVRKMALPDGSYEVEYVVPGKDKGRILDELNPMKTHLTPNCTRFCLHQQKTFRLARCRVIRYNGRNLLVSPWYDQTGGTLLDWVAPSCAGKGEAACTESGEVFVATLK